jgi:hypothetical protein
VFRPDLNGGEAARHAEPGDKGVQHIAGIVTRMPHRRGDKSLALSVYRLAPVHHRRQHDA